jgi:NDP-sugar pyrophosphorylase family protein
MAGLMRAFFQDGQSLGLNICYSHEKQPLGTAGPLSVIDGLDETFVVANGDVLTTLKIDELVAFHHQKQAIATIASHHRAVHIDLGVLETQGDHYITGYIEKPNIDYQVSMGVYVFEPRVIEYIPKGEYLDFPDLVKKLIAAGEKVAAYPFTDYWKDLGRPDDYEQASQDFEAMRSAFLGDE